LLIGIDARPGENTGRSDTMMIVTLDPDNNTIKLTSLMRDLYVEIPGYKNNRINAAYVFGGPELLMATIEKNFGIHIDNYIAVNFSMLGSLIDSIGGLTLTVESEYYKDRINAVIREDNKVLGIDSKDGFLTSAGEQLMTGKQAQAYARYRYGTKDGDFGRTERQREVITKIFEKLSQMTALELMSLVMDNASNVFTNLSAKQLASFAPVLISMKDAEIAQLRLPIDGGYSSKTISGMSVLVPNRTKNMNALMDFLGE
jgi:LCP family protein required for cell wall assembly